MDSGNRPTKGSQVTAEPLVSAHSIVTALQTRDPLTLQAVLEQVDKRAAALVAKPAPRDKPDLLLDYLQQNPGCEGVFAAWDLANKTNSSPLSTAVLSCLTSLLRLLSTDPFTPSPEVIKTLLSAQYTPYLERALNPGRNDVTTAALKLSNVLVGFAGGRFARRLFGAFGWSPKITSRLLKTRLRTLTSSTALTRPDLRTLLVLLVMGFLSAGDVRLKQQVLETKGLLSGVWRGLSEDPEVVVNLVLETVGREVVRERRVGLEARRGVFDEGTINEIVKLYTYPVPAESSDLPDSHPSLSVHRFLRLVAHWLADQIASSPPGRSGGPQKVLGMVLRSLKVTEEREQRELGLEILEGAPVLCGAFWSKFPSSLDPRLSSRWISAITFATQVVSLPVPLTLSPSLSSSFPTTPAPPSLSSILDAILPPPTSSSLTRAWYTKALTHDTPLVSFLSSLFLLAILQKAAKVLEALAETSRRLEEGEGGRWAGLARRVREEVKGRVPDPAIVVGVMSRTAQAAAGLGGENKEKEGKKGQGQGKKGDIEPVPAGAEGALLRTNVALRLLFLYHRVCPALIASLKFDFTKLPQTFAASPSSSSSSSRPSSASSPPTLISTQPGASSSSSAEETVEEGALSNAGLSSISSSYALRLAAAHSASSGSAQAAWSRPADHYKHVLVPLFELYRRPATRSNKELVREILGRMLRSPVLFSGAGREEEEEVWLRAVPVPGLGEDGDGEGGEERKALEFFQEAVRKTLTTPASKNLASTSSSSGEETPFSPLLRTVLASLPSLPSPPPPSVLAFLHALFLAFLSSSPSLALPRKLFTELKDALTLKGDEGRKVVKGMKEALQVVEGKEGGEESAPREVLEKLEDEEDEESEEGELRRVLEGLGPRGGNLFLALSGSGEGQEGALKRAVELLPIPLVLLHARASDLLPSSPSSSLILSRLLAAPSSEILPAVQILLHRFVNAPSAAVGEFLSRVYGQIVEAEGREEVRREVRERVGGREGGRRVWEKEGESGEVYSATATLLAALFSPSSARDAELIKPFCDAVVSDLASTSSSPKKRKSKSSSPGALSARVLSASPLLAFFDASSSLPLLDALLSSSPSASEGTDLLEASFKRVLALPPSPELNTFWSTHFLRLNELSASASASGSGSEAAGELMVKGAEALLPFSLSPSSSASSFGLREDSGEWKSKAGEWATALLSGSGEKVTEKQGKTLAALVYRSKEAREKFLAYLSAAGGREVVSVAAPLRALLEVRAAGGAEKEEEGELPEGLAEEVVKQVVSSPSSSSTFAGGEEDSLAVVRLLASSSAPSIRPTLSSHLETLGRDDFRASVVRVVSAFVQAVKEEEGGDPKEVLEGYVNGRLEGLVRRFAEDEEDGEEVKELVGELHSVVEKNDKLVLKGHLLSPLITAVATRRLDQGYAVELATALSRVHQFKDNEVTRHLNEIFASSIFISFTSSALSPETRTLAVPALRLVLALSSSSPSAASSARTANRLIPFYRGTLSTLDRSLLTLFQRIELVSGQSISPVLKRWNPSLPDAAATLDGTRVGALGAAQRAFTRRSWSRAFASSRTDYSEKDDEKTYDPRFVVGFVLAMVEEEELKVQEWTAVLESGALGTVVASLASSEEGLRLMARATLAALFRKIKPLSFREKDELLLVLTQARLTIFYPAGEPIPASIALFLAHCTSLIGQPDSPLYPAFQRFLLQRATVDPRDVPMFYSMLYSSNTDEFAAAPREERKWMVKYLTEGLVRTQDWKIYRRRQVFELLASLFQASRSDAPLRKLILQFLLRATTIPTAARELLSRNGLLGWLAAQSPLDIAERRLLVSIVQNVVEVLSFEEGKLGGVADAIEALEVAVGNEVAAIDTSTLLDLTRLIVSRLPPSASLSSLVLTRLTSLVLRLSATLTISTTPQAVLQRFYLTVMALSFVRFEAGLVEGKKERELWSLAVEAGMKAGVEELRREVVKRVCT
ncbi:hypothetical protein JCM8547_000217 [Rhodosporidiobolus lusitaniae]